MMRSCLVLAFFLFGCARAPIQTPDQAMRPARTWPSLGDDLEMKTLVQALESTIQRWQARSDVTVSFGPRTIKKDDYVRGLQFLLGEAKGDPTGARFRMALQTYFEPFEVYGDKDWGQVLVTSYFEPVIEGSLKATSRFKQPLYTIPKDMVEIDLTTFERVRPQLTSLRASPLEQRSSSNILRGRMVNSGDVLRVVAMPDRHEINDGVLKGQSQPLCWVDPIDAFFLEIQGSGVIRIKEGHELKVGYAAQNGHPYVPIGRFLLDKIPKEQLSLQTIEAHLRSLPEDQARALMEQNPSYVFFRRLETAGQTFFGTDVISGRTIATDQGLFPKGTLAFLEYQRPVFADEKGIAPSSWQSSSRFVVDHDTGGAIRGPHRVDLFWGRGIEAKRFAGVMKNPGRLTYFVPRAELLLKLGAPRLGKNDLR